MSFADFSHQAQVVQVLQRSLRQGRLAHAYLLVGREPEELEALARSLAKTLNCDGPATANEPCLDSCDHCPTCRRIEEQAHPDVTWVRPESRSRAVTIDQIRAAMQTVNLKPVEARCKVTIVVAADRLNVQAANAFLKTLEEPPPNSIFLLLSTEPQRLIETLVSRCLRLNFVGGGVARQMDDRRRRWLTAFSETAAAPRGGLLGRYQLLGRLLANLAEIRAEVEKRLEARSPLAKYDDLDPELREKWEKELEAATEAEYRRQRTDVLIAMQDWLRDVWLRTVAAPDELLGVSELRPAAETVAKRLSPRQGAGNLEIMEDLHSLLGSNVQEALALEVSLLRLSL
jgi:DNA polymerase III subunit delta'